MPNTLIATVLASSLVAVPTGEPRDVIPPEQVKLTLNRVNGTGCPAGTVDLVMNDNNRSFTTIFSSYIAQTGPNIGPAEARRTCQINLKVHVPHGYTYGILAADYRGGMKLAAGSEAMLTASYYFSAWGDEHSRVYRYRGDRSGDFKEQDRIPWENVVFNPCGDQRMLNLKSMLMIDKAAAHSMNMIAMDSIDVEVATTYQFAWKKCRA